jgi:hypothetical protein
MGKASIFESLNRRGKMGEIQKLIDWALDDGYPLAGDAAAELAAKDAALDAAEMLFEAIEKSYRGNLSWDREGFEGDVLLILAKIAAAKGGLT